ncbi:IPExxxVDY family protein [Foetidibacter luteolus]|uniref:IPExxxVDY family protein n=1 Tax=Foetidibacter luteolus TaxID=2608880 RepID=UPI001F448CDA|nr:IPExxxVDY family protein [Foetidibacter luteolus]
MAMLQKTVEGKAEMKFTLSIDDVTDDFFSDTRLLGIMSAAKNYRFCWQLNSFLGYSFRLNRDIEIHLRKRDRSYFFPVYHHAVRNNFLQHYVYHNACDGEYLLPEFKHIDFLWLMKGDCTEDKTCTEVIQAIKSINGVQLVTELTNEKIKNKGHLVF